MVTLKGTLCDHSNSNSRHFRRFYAVAGPGFCGGNPLTASEVNINSFTEGYFITAPYPTSTVSKTHGERYNFDLAGSSLEITKLSASSPSCAAAGPGKTVCGSSSEHALDALVTFANQDTYELKLSSTVLRADDMRDLFDRLVLSFVDLNTNQGE